MRVLLLFALLPFFVSCSCERENDTAEDNHTAAEASPNFQQPNASFQSGWVSYWAPPQMLGSAAIDNVEEGDMVYENIYYTFDDTTTFMDMNISSRTYSAESPISDQIKENREALLRIPGANDSISVGSQKVYYIQQEVQGDAPYLPRHSYVFHMYGADHWLRGEFVCYEQGDGCIERAMQIMHSIVAKD